MAKPESHKWEFKARFRRNAFGWRSQPAITRVRQAVAEIKKIARKDLVAAAEGAVLFLERVSPALEHVDSSSGSMGTAVNNAITELVPIVAAAPADMETRKSWLKRLRAALEADQMPYLELLGDFWGDLCASAEVASEQADAMLGITRRALSPKRGLREYYSGTSACLSALFRAGRYSEIYELAREDDFWPYQRWVVKALAAEGKGEEAICHAESCRGPWASDVDIDRHCEEILLSAGLEKEAYERYGLTANRASTYLATFRAVVRKYPHKSAAEVLADLVDATPGEEGKWFAAAKQAGLYEQALALASRSPCDPKTLTRAARDYAGTEPEFAVGAGLLALGWLVEGHGYDITGADVWAAYDWTMKAAEAQGASAEVEQRIRQLVAAETFGERFVSKILGRKLGL